MHDSNLNSSLETCSSRSLVSSFSVYLSLLHAGYSIDEIAAASLEVERIKKMRAESLERQNWDRFNIFMESATRTLRTMVDVKPILVNAKMA